MQYEKNSLFSLEYGFKIIEDGSHASGKYLDKPIGVVNILILQFSVFTQLKLSQLVKVDLPQPMISNFQKNEIIWKYGITREIN